MGYWCMSEPNSVPMPIPGGASEGPKMPCVSAKWHARSLDPLMLALDSVAFWPVCTLAVGRIVNLKHIVYLITKLFLGWCH